MFGTKQAILAIAGISTLGGASAGCYYCFKPKAPESSQPTSSSSLSTSTTTQRTTPKTEGTPNRDTSIDTNQNSNQIDQQTQLQVQPQSLPSDSASIVNPSSETGPQGPRG